MYKMVIKIRSRQQFLNFDFLKILIIDKQMSFSNFSNPFSLLTAPTRPNQNQTVPITNIDTHDWTIAHDGALVCQNPGVWSVLSQYQLVNIHAVKDCDDAQIDGWFIVNNQHVTFSDATSTACQLNSKNVLAIGLEQAFNVGDRLEFGIRSSSDHCLNAVVKSYTAPTGIVAPSLIVSLSKRV
jgi:hypothetical protein